MWSDKRIKELLNETSARHKLEAAAPDLLEACKQAFQFIQRRCEIDKNPTNALHSLRDNVHKAINKAREV